MKEKLLSGKYILKKEVKMLDIPKNKLLSARRIIAIRVITTYCIIMIGVLALTLINKLSIEAFLGVLGGFGTLVLAIAAFYFERKDREKKEV